MGWLQDECNRQGYTACRPADFKLETWKTGPLQNNGIDCGVCALALLEILAECGPGEFYKTRRDGYWDQKVLQQKRAQWGCQLKAGRSGTDQNSEELAQLIAAAIQDDEAMSEELAADELDEL